MTALNGGAVKINTVTSLTPTDVEEEFLRDLAAANGGSYTRIRRF